MAKARWLGKVESIAVQRVWFGLGAGQGIAIVEPFEQIAVAAARAAERGVFGAAWFAAERAFSDVLDHSGTACANAADKDC